MAEITDIYWTIEEMLLSGMKLITYRDAANGQLLGTWITNRSMPEIEKQIRENKQALVRAFNGGGSRPAPT